MRIPVGSGPKRVLDSVIRASVSIAEKETSFAGMLVFLRFSKLVFCNDSVIFSNEQF